MYGPDKIFTTQIVSAVKDAGHAPSRYGLTQNYPNPFNPSTKFDYQLLRAGRVSLIVYNMLGQEVSHLVDKYAGAGIYSAVWDAVSEPSGLYYARMIVSDAGGNEVYRQIRKVVLIK